MHSDPITIELIEQLLKQRKDAVSFEDKVKVAKDFFQVLLDSGIIDKSSEITGSGNTIFIDGQAIRTSGIIRLLEKNS